MSSIITGIRTELTDESRPKNMAAMDYTSQHTCSLLSDYWLFTYGINHTCSPTHYKNQSWTDSRCTHRRTKPFYFHARHSGFWSCLFSSFVGLSLSIHRLSLACFLAKLVCGFGSVCMLFFNKAFICNCSRFCLWHIEAISRYFTRQFQAKISQK